MTRTEVGPLRIVAHNGAAIFGGAERAVVNLLSGLADRGHDVLLLCRDAEMVARVANRGVPAAVQRIGGTVMLPDAVRFARVLRRSAPDVLLLTTFKKVFLAGAGARMAGVPRVVQRVGLSTDVPRGPLYRLALRSFVDGIVLNAEAMRAGFLAADPELDPGRLRVIHNGVRAPVRRAAPGSVRRALSLPADARVVGAVARLATQKRFDRLLHALARLPPHVHCVIAGGGEERAALERLSVELRVTGRLHLLGPREDVGDVLDALDLYVVCSDREGLSNAMLEAMAFGVPVLSTPVSGAGEALEPLADGTVPGTIVDFDDAALAVEIERLLSDPPSLATMARAGRTRARERFSFEASLDRWEAVLAGPRGRVAAGGAA